jgi:hypothetical protein
MITVFWDCEGVILVNVMQRGDTIRSDACIRTLTELRKHFKEFGMTRIKQKSCFSVKMPGHKSVKAWEAITKFGWTVLPHPLYIPDLSPSDFKLSGALNKTQNSRSKDLSFESHSASSFGAIKTQEMRQIKRSEGV